VVERYFCRGVLGKSSLCVTVFCGEVVVILWWRRGFLVMGFRGQENVTFSGSFCRGVEKVANSRWSDRFAFFCAHFCKVGQRIADIEKSYVCYFLTGSEIPRS
jgi:hypothetical protein